MPNKVTAELTPVKVPQAVLDKVLMEEKLAASQAAAPSVDDRVKTATSKLSMLDIERIAESDPQQAMLILSLREKLDAARKQEDQKQQHGQFQMRMLVEVEQQIAALEANQYGCSQTGHSMPNQESALHGQTDSKGVYRMTCVRCFQNYAGIGSGPGELPQHLASRVDWENVGKGH